MQPQLKQIREKLGRLTTERLAEVEDRRGMVVAQLELAWPSRRLGVAISQEDLEAAQAALWNTIPVHKAVDV